MEQALAQAPALTWSEPVNISKSPDYSWFPDLAVDAQGNVHVIWCETVALEMERHREQVFYTMWDGESWSEPNDVVPPSAEIVRSAIAVDRGDTVHMLFGGSVYDILTLYHQRAYARDAWSAATWTTPHRISQGTSYMGDIAVDSEGTLHLVYDDILGYRPREEDVAVADIHYRHSVDGGRTWSLPVSFPSVSTGSSRSQLEIDSSDTIHLAWDEGWDRLTGLGDPIYSAYTSSSDGGATWSPVLTVTYPITTVAQLTVGSDGNGGVLLAWRATSRDEIFYQWSTDGGRSWDAPSVIPEIFARPWANPFDMYDMATDSAGHIHLVVVGRQVRTADAPLGVYHLEWDGQAWSNVDRIYGGADSPEYPKIAIHEGNQLHVVWFVRQSLWGDERAGPNQVWYSSGQSTAPRQVTTPLPTPTPLPLTPTPTPFPTATPYPTLSLEGTGLPDGLHTESDDVFRLAIALSPVVLLVLGVIVARMGWFGTPWR